MKPMKMHGLISVAIASCGTVHLGHSIIGNKGADTDKSTDRHLETVGCIALVIWIVDALEHIINVLPIQARSQQYTRTDRANTETKKMQRAPS